MGTFLGHALPGSFFYFYGVWSLVNCFYIILTNPNGKLLKSKQSGSGYKKNSKNDDFQMSNLYDRQKFPLPKQFSFKLRFCGRVVPIESMAKVVFCGSGMFYEGIDIFWGMTKMYQHFTMYSIFGFCGLVDICLYFNVPIPQKMDFILHHLAFSIEGLLFMNHLHGGSHLDVAVHTMVIYSSFFCSFAVFLAMIQPQNPIFRILVGMGALVQGSWFWQAGAILFPLFGSRWDEEKHDNVMVVVVIFCWHIMLDSLFVIFLYGLMSCIGCKSTVLIGEYDSDTSTYQNSKNRNFKSLPNDRQISKFMNSNNEEDF